MTSRFDQQACEGLYSALPMSIAASAAVALMLVSIQSTLVPPGNTFLWIGVTLLTLIWSTALVVARRLFAGQRNTKFWLWHFRVNIFAHGIVWALSPVLLLPSDDITSQAFIAFILAGISAGALISFQVDRVTALGFTLPALLALTGILIFENTPVSRAMGLMVLIYSIFYMISSQRAASQLKEKFHLQDLLL